MEGFIHLQQVSLLSSYLTRPNSPVHLLLYSDVECCGHGQSESEHFFIRNKIMTLNVYRLKTNKIKTNVKKKQNRNNKKVNKK